MPRINKEQIKDLANLFDIKVMSQAIANKSWSCISSSQPNRLTKSSVPTAYNFLKDKLDTADATIEGWQSKSFNDRIFSVIIDDNLLISYHHYGIYKCKIGEINDSSKWTQINVTLNGTNVPDFARANVVITDKVVCFTTVDGSLRYLIVLDRYTLEEVKSISLNFNTDVRFTSSVNNYIFIGINNTTYRIPNTNIANDIVLETVKSGSDIRLVFKFDGVYYYYVHREGGYPASWRIYKTTDFNTTIFVGWLSAFGPDAYKCVFTYDNKGNIYNLLQTNTIKKSKNIETWNGSGTEVWEDTTLDFTNYGSAYTNASEIMFVFKNQTGFVIAYNLQDGGASVIYSNDLKNFQFIIKTSFGFSSYREEYADANGNYANYGKSSTLYFSQPIPVKTVYTDTINGIDIKYYKNGDWRICTPDIAVGNDDNLQSVYEYLGYLNYWWIDEINEQITLQRDKRLWTFMYVGDDYEEPSLPIGEYIPASTKNDVNSKQDKLISGENIKTINGNSILGSGNIDIQGVGYNTFSNKSILATDWVADNTYLGYSYKCDIPCTGVTSTMYAQVTFAPEEAMSGNYANICDTGTGVVTIYSKVAEAITIPMIMVLGV